MSNEVANALKEVLQQYANKIFLNKLTVEEILEMLECDIKYLREAEGGLLLNNIKPEP